MPKTPEEMAQDINLSIEALKKDLGNAVKTEDFKAVEKTLNDFIEANKDIDFTALKSELSDISEQLGAIKEKVIGAPSHSTMKGVIDAFITEKHTEIKDIFKAGSGSVAIDVDKAVGTMTTGSATPVGTVPDYFYQQYAPAPNVNLRQDSIMSRVTTLQTSLAAYPYTETLPKDGDFAFLAEAEVKPEIDFTIETRFETPKKVAAWIKLTEESVTDIIGLQSIATDLLFKKHNRKKAKGILNGDGIAPNPKGATAYGRLFSAGALANTVDNPNIMDVINAAVTDIFTTHNYTDEMSYMANIAMLSPVDFFINFVAAKDGFGHPLYPQAGLFNMVVIGGVLIVPDEDIASGKVFVADLSKYNVTNYVPYSVRIGWVNDDFIKNQFVILGESRFHAFVKRLDQQAFIYDDIATIKTAITLIPAP